MSVYIPASLEQELQNYGAEPMIRVVMMPKDTNYQGSIFGGVILSHLDLAAAEEALKSAGRPIVTKIMREVDFVAKVQVSDWVSYYTRTERCGRTSVTVRVLVVAHRGPLRKEIIKVTSAEVIFVAVDDEGNPAPLLGPGAKNH